jgi:uncharacterized protein YegL
VANEFKVDSALPRSLLKAHDLHLAGNMARKQWTTMEKTLARRVDARRRDGSFERTDELVLRATELFPERRKDFAGIRLENLLQLAEATTAPAIRLARFKDAAALAKAEGSLSLELQHALDQAEREYEATLPIRLTPGHRVEVLRQTTDFQPPVLLLEIAVIDASRRPVQELSAKDFLIEVDGQAVQGMVSPLETNRGHLSIVVLLDHSGSTQGEPARAARDGIQRFAESLPSHSSLRVMGFADTPSWLTDWDADSQGLNRKLAVLPSHGGTALFVALETALRELAAMPQPRAVVLFTDGKDSKLSDTLIDEAVQRIGVYRTPTHIVALRTREFDEQVLRRVASVTQGSLVTVDRLDQLLPHFERLATALRISGFRLVIPLDAGHPTDVRLTIGREHPVQLRLAAGEQSAADGRNQSASAKRVAQE